MNTEVQQLAQALSWEGRTYTILQAWQEAVVRSIPGFLSVACYGLNEPVADGEIGRIDKTHYVIRAPRDA